MFWFRSGKRILTIGSVHLDTIALSSSPTSFDEVTHVVNIIHSVGGSAYNIAANLASHQRIKRPCVKLPSIPSFHSTRC